MKILVFIVYYLAILQDNLEEPKLINELRIFKRALSVKPAWQIGVNDEDFVVLHIDDDPVIPDGIEDAPVWKALERKKEMNSRKK